MSRPHSDVEITALIAATRSLRAPAAAGHVSPPWSGCQRWPGSESGSDRARQPLTSCKQ